MDRLFLIAAKAADAGLDIPGSGIAQGQYSWSSYILSIYRFSIKLGSSLVVLMIIFGAYKIITSQGDTKKVTEGKDMVLGSILGFVLLMVIGIILNFLNLPEYDVTSTGVPPASAP